MPTNRFQFSDDFVLNNGYVGINSATPQEELDVVGVVRGDNLKVVGVSSFSVYEGFLNSNQNITENINLDANRGITGSLSGEVVVGTGLTITGIGSAVSGQGYIDSLKVYTTLNVPVGLTTDRPIAPKPGQLFYNREFATVEFYTGDAWRQVDNTTQRGRGVFGGGQTPAVSGTIDFINISSTGNTLNFGVLSVTRRGLGSCSSSVRGLFGGGYAPGFSNVIDYVTIASEGNALDFGDLLATASKFVCSALSSSTRGIFAGGEPFNNVIEYVQIATIGNSLDFGDLTTNRDYNSSCSSPTRGVFGGGLSSFSAPSGYVKTTEFITISSTGNGIVFGDLTAYRHAIASCSNTTRGIFAGGANPTIDNTIDFITIASTGNAQDFGDLTTTKSNAGAVSTSIRGVFGGGATGSPATTFNVIDYVTIATVGNAIDFGDISTLRNQISAHSDSHGGLGGF